jgi:SAM-dependent methyltransferase
MLKVSQEIIKDIVKNQKQIYGGAISPSWSIESQVAENYSEKMAERDWKAIKRVVSVDKKAKILDLGCGYGFLVAYLRRHGFNCFGCDTDLASLKIARKLLYLNGLRGNFVKRNQKRDLPFKSESFDLVNLNYVLVYVDNWPLLFKEIKRVLKKKGQVYIVTPNYQCCYDVNYGLFLIPWLPKWFNKLYLQIMGRKNWQFFSTFNFTTKRALEALFKREGFVFEDIGIKNWQKSIEQRDLTNRSQAYRVLISGVKLCRLEPLMLFLAKLGFYTPLIYILKKEH